MGDSDFNANSTTVTFTITEQKVELMNTTIDVDINSIENDVTITASVDSSASGLVEFNIGGQAVYVAVANWFILVIPNSMQTELQKYLLL